MGPLLEGIRKRFFGIRYEDRLRNELEAHSSHLRGREVDNAVVRSVPVVDVFSFAMQLYGPYLLARMPNLTVQDYIKRRQTLRGRPIRILSLGCGAGDWEFDLARQVRNSIEFTLVDINEHLMEAATRLSKKEGLPFQTQVQDVNNFKPEPGAFDFVICRSSLHHFLELETVFAEIRRALAAQGEFVVIGEWVGRNGLQMYPETERAVQKIFDSLPARLRKNRYTGKTDARVPNIDHSINSFEAVRSEDIMPLLLKNFEPVEYVLYDAYVSLLLDFRYGPNYDLNKAEDREIATHIVETDIEHITNGTLRPTAMFGIYR